MTHSVSFALADKYLQEDGRIYLTAVQALIRLSLLQKQIDTQMERRTAGYVTGYRGSPLGTLDQQFRMQHDLLGASDIHFHAAVNEDLAATAINGTQQASLLGENAYDGVFAMWYGKGPGVDRSGDVFRHGNLLGTDPLGGVLLLAGDDHACESSTTAHQSEFAFVDASIPILSPTSIRDVIAFGLYGWAMSRQTGCWIGMKAVKDIIETTGVVDLDGIDRLALYDLHGDAFRRTEVHAQLGRHPIEQERVLHELRIPAVRRFADAHPLGHRTSYPARVGIVTSGKTWGDLRQALKDLSLDAEALEAHGIALYAPGVVSPLPPETVRQWAATLEAILVIEEKRPLIEPQLATLLFGKDIRLFGRNQWPGNTDDVRELRNAYDGVGTSAGTLNAIGVATQLAGFLREVLDSAPLRQHLAAQLEGLAKRGTLPARLTPTQPRQPWFCGGCPHNRSTQVPEGARAAAGIGCHYMSLWMERDTHGFTQMGGEGAQWIGESLFSTRPHMIQNIGDGTWFHSGSLAIRAAVAAKVNMTYKLLWNDAVAMTGGQAIDGEHSPATVAHQCVSEGVRAVAYVGEVPATKQARKAFPPSTLFFDRDDVLEAQKQLQRVVGTSVLIFDQTCAAEKRRRRKRGLMAPAPATPFINAEVCTNCGDCTARSNCIAVVPRSTELGQKRAIDYSACNEDLSCTDGFCPSFVLVSRRTQPVGAPISTPVASSLALPESLTQLPTPEWQNERWRAQGTNILLAGVGGSGTTTIGALLTVAAFMDGHSCSALDMAGLAQKGGAVYTHIRLAPVDRMLTSTRLGIGEADVLISGEPTVAATASTLRLLSEQTSAVVSRETQTTGDFVLHGKQPPQSDAIHAIIAQRAAKLWDVPCNTIAQRVFGDRIFANTILLGVAWQSGLLPVSGEALQRAIETNGIRTKDNLQAFEWGRAWAHAPQAVYAALDEAGQGAQGRANKGQSTWLESYKKRADHLKSVYGNAVAASYSQRIDRLRGLLQNDAVQSQLAIDPDPCLATISAMLYEALAVKDAYAVAHAYSRPAFWQEISEQFGNRAKVEFLFAPPVPPLFAAAQSMLRLRRPNQPPRKRHYGRGTRTALSLLARWGRYRNTWLDPFRNTPEHRADRWVSTAYCKTIDDLLHGLEMIGQAHASDKDSPAAAAIQHLQALDDRASVLRMPERVRGYGHIRLSRIDRE